MISFSIILIPIQFKNKIFELHKNSLDNNKAERSQRKIPITNQDMRTF